MKWLKAHSDILVMAAGFAVLGFIFSFYPLYILSALCLLSLVYAPAERTVVKYWKMAGRFMGTINSTILLTVFFYLFLFPFSMLIRAFSGRRQAPKSAWKDVNGQVDFSKPW